MSRPGARAASRLVRLVQSDPLEMRMLTQRVRSATDRRPSGCPAKTFKTVIWKLTRRLATGKYPHWREGSWTNAVWSVRHLAQTTLSTASGQYGTSGLLED